MAHALNHSTGESLVLIDEFGKGTNTVREGKRGVGREGRGGGRRKGESVCSQQSSALTTELHPPLDGS